MRHLLLSAALLLDSGFVASLLNGAAEAGMPHTTGELAAILGGALYFVGSQLFQRIANRRQLKRDLADALAQHGITPAESAPLGNGV